MPPNPSARSGPRLSMASPGTMKIPLNDDDAEKASRNKKKRTMMQEVQIRRQSFINAATPRKALDGGNSQESTPKTPRNSGMLRESLNPITPLRSGALVTNFEEWMKMVNDNKINATNSWNNALIDYFHDLSLLKEGEGINFQKASCTLDGCVKIYNCRVDSVATETGKLLSGLADSGGSKKKSKGDDDNEGGEDEDDSDGENGSRKKKKRTTTRSSEATLVKDFSSIQLKKLEQEFSVDPLFKKASADFDEGGAKGLLQNHLSLDSTGRIVFDSSDDTEEAPVNDEEENNKDDESAQADVDLTKLREQFFPNLAELDELDVCPSMKTFDLGDPATSNLDVLFLRAALDDRPGDNPADDDDDDGDDFFGNDAGGGFDSDNDLGFPGADGTMAFGDGGMILNSETLGAIGGDRFATPSRSRAGSVFDAGVDGEGRNKRGRERLSLGGLTNDDAVLTYFDEALKKNWAGPEHWKIKKIKEAGKAPAAPRPRREKEVFEINFMSAATDVTQEMLLPKSSTANVLPKAQRKSKTRHLLPDDKHFNSKDLIQLFLKPKARFGGIGIRAKRSTVKDEDVDPVDMDEGFWAKQQQNKEAANAADGGQENIATGQYDANFFNDDAVPDMNGMHDVDDDDDIGGIGGEAFEAPIRNDPVKPTFPFLTQELAMGSQLVTANRRVRPEYVNFARVAKKVDVRRLKENIWNDIGTAISVDVPMTPRSTNKPTEEPIPEPKKFTDVIQNLQAVYPKEAMNDISTSYCFICVLHLANEKGLILESNETLTDLRIEKDLTANGPDAY